MALRRIVVLVALLIVIMAVSIVIGASQDQTTKASQNQKASLSVTKTTPFAIFQILLLH